MEDKKSFQLTQVGIGQLIFDIIAKINAEGGPTVTHEVDNQLNWVDIYLAGDSRDKRQRVQLTIFSDSSDNRGYGYIVNKVEADIRTALKQIYIACPKCGKTIRSPLMGDVDPVSGQAYHYVPHECESSEVKQ